MNYSERGLFLLRHFCDLKNKIVNRTIYYFTAHRREQNTHTEPFSPPIVVSYTQSLATSGRLCTQRQFVWCPHGGAIVHVCRFQLSIDRRWVGLPVCQ